MWIDNGTGWEMLQPGTLIPTFDETDFEYREEDHRRFGSHRVYRHTFPSWRDFIEHAKPYGEQRLGRDNVSFRKATNEEILKMADEGWEEGIQNATPIVNNVVTHIEQEALVERAEVEWQVSGCEVDVGRFVQGVPECMIEYEPFVISTVGRVVTLIASVGALASYTPEQMIRKGEAVIALAMALEETQHSVEIWLDSTVCESYDRMTYLGSTRVLLKSATQALDAELIAYALGHPSVLRYWVFADRWSFPAEWRKRLDIDTGSMGCSLDPIEDGPAGTLYMPALDNRRNVPDPERFVVEKLKDLGLLRG